LAKSDILTRGIGSKTIPILFWIKIIVPYTPMEEKLTIVIPCKNEEKYIFATLESLSRQKIGSTQIYLADGNSSDLTLSRAKMAAFLFNLNLKIIPGGKVAEGRNAGAALAKTPYVLFLDADVTFTPHMNLDFCVQKMGGKTKLLSTTPVSRAEGDWKAEILFCLNRWGTTLISQKEPFAVGSFTMVDRESFWSKGGFDSEVKHTEDWLFSRQFEPEEFCLIPNLITQDSRRFKRFGYLKMANLVIRNWQNRNKREYFLKEAGYWI
jgi:glycosyltransferase involved in cell wall biosynthesis